MAYYQLQTGPEDTFSPRPVCRPPPPPWTVRLSLALPSWLSLSLSSCVSICSCFIIMKAKCQSIFQSTRRYYQQKR